MSDSDGNTQMKKIKTAYRILTLFICLCMLVNLAGILMTGLKEDIFVALALAIVFISTLYICLPVVFTGYPPKLFIKQLKENDSE